MCMGEREGENVCMREREKECVWEREKENVCMRERERERESESERESLGVSMILQHIKEPLFLIGKSSPCSGGSGCPLLLSE